MSAHWNSSKQIFHSSFIFKNVCHKDHFVFLALEYKELTGFLEPLLNLPGVPPVLFSLSGCALRTMLITKTKHIRIVSQTSIWVRRVQNTLFWRNALINNHRIFTDAEWRFPKSLPRPLQLSWPPTIRLGDTTSQGSLSTKWVGRMSAPGK